MTLLEESPDPLPDDETSEGRPIGRYVAMGVIGLALIGAAVFGARSLWSTPDRPAPVNSAAADRPRPVETARKPAPRAPDAAPDAARSRAPRAPVAKAEPTPTAEPVETTPVAAGILRVDSDVPGAMVFVDRKFVGNTPLEAKGIDPGSHRVNVSAEGYEGFADTITIAAEPAELMVRFKEVKLDEAIQVVHKHGMGACEGRLHADPQGVSYETTNKDDAFVMKFADIEAFDVDYLKKNLRIKRRGGKTYNFTDKTGNADALLVFQKNVDKARARLARGDAAAK